jgi:hypothetical protein
VLSSHEISKAALLYLYYNFNYGYTAALMMNTLLHRSCRGSKSWRHFCGPTIWEEKRPRGTLETLMLGMFNDSKHGQIRRNGAYSEADVLAAACRLYNNPVLQFGFQVSGMGYWLQYPMVLGQLSRSF